MEWLLFMILVSLVTLLAFQFKGLSHITILTSLCMIGILVFSARFWKKHRLENEMKERAYAQTLPREGRPGFVSSDTCRACHPSEYASWHMSYHRTMTQYASPESVRGNFDHPPLNALSSPIVLEKVGKEYWVEMDDPDWIARRAAQPDRFSSREIAPRARKRIGLVTGSHHMQVYWIPSEKGNLQHLFPYAYLFEGERWVPFRDTFLRDPKMPDPSQHWNLNCINCHATAGQPRANPNTRRVDTRVAEIGIACEACHGSAQKHIEHYRNPLHRYRADRAQAIDPSIVHPEKLDAKRASMICGQCHGISWISNSQEYQQIGFRFQPGDLLNLNQKLIRAAHLDEQPYLKESLKRNPRFILDRYWSDGMVRVSGREYSAMMESPCHQNGELSCLSCHDLHHDFPQSLKAMAWRNDQLKEMENEDQACTQCHKSIADQLESHTHHPVSASGSRCYNCHMPHTTYGLLKAIRSHHIDNPSVQTTLETGRPNACNLCHLDKSLAWTAEHLTLWYEQPKPSLSPEQKEVAASLLWLVKGDAGQRALLSWHYGWETAKEVSGKDWMAFALAQSLVDPYSAVRFIAHRSLKKLNGFEDFEYDFIAPESQRKDAQRRARNIWEAQISGKKFGTNALLLSETGQPDRARFEELIRTRDNRSIDLQE